MTTPMIAWNRIGMKMKTHSTKGKMGPSAWILSTLP